MAATAYNPAGTWVTKSPVHYLNKDDEENSPATKFALPPLEPDRQTRFDAAKTQLQFYKASDEQMINVDKKPLSDWDDDEDEKVQSPFEHDEAAEPAEQEV